MERIKDKIVILQQALNSLEKSIALFKEHELICKSDPTEKNAEIVLAMQGYMIQCFEFSVDLFWKTLKVYLEDRGAVLEFENTPKSVIRACVEARLLSESEGEACIKMINNRNETSQLYKLEVAEIVGSKVPGYYSLMSMLIDRIQESIQIRL